MPILSRLSARFPSVLVAAAASLCVLGGAHAAMAEVGDTPAKPVTGGQFRNVTRACTADYPRFCPAGTASTASGREQVMCLKFFKNDLTLGCRRAVTAAAGK